MPMLDRDGVKLYYEVTGPEDGQVPFLLTHGYSASAAMWTGNLPALSKDRQVITWDIRGHARSDSPEDMAQYSEALSVEDMAALLDLVGAERAVIGGLSLGGYLSLAFHLRYPERTVALVLCDTGPGYRRPEGRDGWNNGMVEQYVAAAAVLGSVAYCYAVIQPVCGSGSVRGNTNHVRQGRSARQDSRNQFDRRDQRHLQRDYSDLSRGFEFGNYNHCSHGREHWQGESGYTPRHPDQQREFPGDAIEVWRR